MASESNEVSKWYEQYVGWLLGQSGAAVEREPRINGQTPDLLATQQGGTTFIVECFVKLMYPAHQKEMNEHRFHSCGGDIRELHGAIHSRVEQKAAKYRNLGSVMPYVVAIYDMSCMNHVDTAMSLAFSAWVPYLRLNSEGTAVGSGYADQWSTPERSEGIFYRYPNVSGLLYSRWEKEHNFLPNPFADIPIATELFPFARIPEAPMIDGKPAWTNRDRLLDDNYPLPPNTCWGQVRYLAQTIAKLADRCRDTEPVQPQDDLKMVSG